MALRACRGMVGVVKLKYVPGFRWFEDPERASNSERGEIILGSSPVSAALYEKKIYHNRETTVARDFIILRETKRKRR